MQTVIFDIDGTLADIEHRRHFVRDGNKNWKAFNAAMGDDTVFDAVAGLYRTLWKTGVYDLQIVTGRTEDFREVTERWLVWNELPFNRVTMRASRDMRPDHIVKEEILDQFLAEGREIAFTVDDRQQVVDMWRRRGITCLQCDVGDF
ncbi:MAG: polynucleotide kinase [Pseudomonadota bacterium]